MVREETKMADVLAQERVWVSPEEWRRPPPRTVGYLNVLSWMESISRAILFLVKVLFCGALAVWWLWLACNLTAGQSIVR
jgi:hypothetical protein